VAVEDEALKRPEDPSVQRSVRVLNGEVREHSEMFDAIRLGRKQVHVGVGTALQVGAVGLAELVHCNFAIQVRADTVRAHRLAGVRALRTAAGCNDHCDRKHRDTLGHVRYRPPHALVGVFSVRQTERAGAPIVRWHRTSPSSAYTHRRCGTRFRQGRILRLLPVTIKSQAEHAGKWYSAIRRKCRHAEQRVERRARKGTEMAASIANDTATPASGNPTLVPNEWVAEKPQEDFVEAFICHCPEAFDELNRFAKEACSAATPWREISSDEQVKKRAMAPLVAAVEYWAKGYDAEAKWFVERIAITLMFAAGAGLFREDRPLTIRVFWVSFEAFYRFASQKMRGIDIGVYEWYAQFAPTKIKFEFDVFVPWVESRKEFEDRTIAEFRRKLREYMRQCSAIAKNDMYVIPSARRKRGRNSPSDRYVWAVRRLFERPRPSYGQLGRTAKITADAVEKAVRRLLHGLDFPIHGPKK
jgi:hypothetical protein